MKIAYLGPEGSYSHLAAEIFLKETKGADDKAPFERDECIPFRNFPEVFAAVESGRVAAAAVPIENSLQGGVLQNLDLLQCADGLYAVREHVLKIDHRLIYRTGTPFREIGRVYSHRQALDQCAAFLSRETPFAALKETESTALGIGKAADDESGKSAAIAGAHTAFIPDGFTMSEECVSDEKNNFTQFLLIEKGRERLPEASDKFFFSTVCPHRPGSLMSLLRIIAAHGINMTKSESRPVKDRPGEYRFFVEAEGDAAGERVKDALSEIEKGVLECKLLGAYKRAK